MNLFEKLYQLTVADRGNPGPRLLNYYDQTASAAASVTHYFTNNSRQPVVVGVLSWNFTPGAAQNYVASICALYDKDNVLVGNVMGESTALGAVVVKRFHQVYNGAVIVPPLFKLGTTGVFNAGANSNNVQFFLHGFYIPVGTLLW